MYKKQKQENIQKEVGVLGISWYFLLIGNYGFIMVLKKDFPLECSPEKSIWKEINQKCRVLRKNGSCSKNLFYGA